MTRHHQALQHHPTHGMADDDVHFACLAVNIINGDFGIADKIIQTKPNQPLAWLLPWPRKLSAHASHPWWAKSGKKCCQHHAPTKIPCKNNTGVWPCSWADTWRNNSSGYVQLSGCMCSIVSVEIKNCWFKSCHFIDYLSNPSCTMCAAFTTAMDLLQVSNHSISGTESATTPPPAWMYKV